jgi:hypothetical protein
MQPIITIEFSSKTGGTVCKEESISFHNPEELFSFIAPGGGCDTIPDEVVEIQLVFLQPPHPNTHNPISDKRVTLELGMVFLTGPLAEIAQTAEQLIDKAGRGELSGSFIKAINIESR